MRELAPTVSVDVISEVALILYLYEFLNEYTCLSRCHFRGSSNSLEIYAEAKAKESQSMSFQK